MSKGKRHKRLTRDDIVKAREIMEFAEQRCKETKPMSRMEAYFLHERIGECLEGIPLGRK